VNSIKTKCFYLFKDESLLTLLVRTLKYIPLQPEPLVWFLLPPPPICHKGLRDTQRRCFELNSVSHSPPATSCAARHRVPHTHAHTSHTCTHRPRVTFVNVPTHTHTHYELHKEMWTTIIKTCQCCSLRYKVWRRAYEGILWPCLEMTGWIMHRRPWFMHGDAFVLMYSWQLSAV